jgi:hypothetical protein
MLFGVVAAWLWTGCATPPEPFEYQQSNELKPGPGFLTGEEGVYTIYGQPPPVDEQAPGSEEERPVKPEAH